MSFALTFTAAALLASPGGSALVFMQVNSPVEPAAKPLLEESLRHAFSSRMPVITCREAIEDETALKKVLEGRDIKSTADAPKKVGLLADFSRYDCEIPPDADLWAAWLTAYVDSRSGRREVSLRMRNLKDKESKPTFASLAEPQDSHVSWSELVERCVRRYFEEDESTQVQVAPVLRVGVRDPFVLHARLSFSSAAEAEGQPKLDLQWRLYKCSGSAGCDRFRDAVDEYVTCRRSNRFRSASDPSLTPVCLEPLEAYDRLSVSALEDQALPWLHWEKDPSPRLAVDIPGEYVLVASARGDLAGAQRVSVEPAYSTAIAFGGLASRPNGADAFFMLSYDYALFEDKLGHVSIGAQWGVRLGAPEPQVPPFGVRGLLAPILRGRHFFTADWIAEGWVAPLGALYRFEENGVGYVFGLGTMVGAAGVWHPGRLPFTFRAGVMIVAETLNPQRSEIYGPLLGIGYEW